MKMRVFEAFAGYGSQSLALERLKRHFPEFDYEVVGISEIDKYAVTAYNVLYHIFRKMFVEKENENEQLVIF